MVGIRLVFHLLLIGSLVLISCAAEEEEKKEALKIGVILPLSGEEASFGEDVITGLKMAEDQINELGGILGKNVKLEICDDGTSPDGAKRCFDKLVSQGIKFIIGPATSSAIIRGICGGAENKSCPAVVSNKVIIISPSATSPLISELNDGGYIWRTPPSDALQGKVLADYAYDDVGARKVSIIYRNDAYGAKLAEAFGEEFRKKGGETWASVGYSEDKTVDFSSEVAELYKYGDPDGIVIISFVDDGINLLKDLQTYITNTGKRKPYLFGVDGVKDKGISSIGEFVKGMSGTAPKPSADDPDYKSFAEAYKSKFRSEPASFLEHAYDAFFVVALGIEAVGEYNPEKVKEVLVNLTNGGEKVKPPASGGNWKDVVQKAKAGADIDYKGVSGDVDFDQNGDVKGGVYEIWQIVDTKGVTEDFKEIKSVSLK